jgi:hypothetical protein
LRAACLHGSKRAWWLGEVRADREELQGGEQDEVNSAL